MGKGVGWSSLIGKRGERYVPVGAMANCVGAGGA